MLSSRAALINRLTIIDAAPSRTELHRRFIFHALQQAHGKI